MIENKNYLQLIEHINNLPNEDDPVIFGLNKNCDIISKTDFSK